jgi:signal transduction histidine kinase
VNNERRFIANVAHELRTPLALQRAAIEIGLDESTPDRLSRVRNNLLEANRRSQRLIDGLLLLAQTDHGLDFVEPVALDAVVRDAVKETTSGASISIRQQLTPTIVEGDAVLLHRLVANLVQNAVRYNRPDGEVEIRLTASGELTVTNTGPEISSAQIDELFKPFVRLRNTRGAVADSFGLGLSIVASIARAHGASIIARPNPGGGLQMQVQFRGVIPSETLA